MESHIVTNISDKVDLLENSTQFKVEFKANRKYLSDVVT